MQIYKIEPMSFGANCYLVTADNKRAIAVDPAEPRVLGEAERLGLKVEHVLLTHGHFDHIGGVGVLFEKGAKVGCLENEVPLVFSENNLAGVMGGVRIDPFEVSETYRDGQETEVCGIKVKVIATPGHTAGSCCYLMEDKLFTGDTLFAKNYGRCDLPTGSFIQMESSLKKLFDFVENYEVYPGHGRNTSLFDEKLFLRYGI